MHGGYPESCDDGWPVACVKAVGESAFCGGPGGGSVRGTCGWEWPDVSRLMAAPARKVEGGDVPFACFFEGVVSLDAMNLEPC